MNNRRPSWVAAVKGRDPFAATAAGSRSEEHTSELQSQSNLVCRLLLEKKKKSLCLPPFHLYSPQIHLLGPPLPRPHLTTLLSWSTTIPTSRTAPTPVTYSTQTYSSQQ